MKKSIILLLSLCFIISLNSCRRKKLQEVVEVPLPASEEKMTIGNPEDVKATDGAFEIVKLPYNYNELAPNIDAMTMEIHFSKHYLTYTNNLNKAIKEAKIEDGLSIEEILKKLDMSDTNLRNNAGAYYNHNLYWDTMIAKDGGKPSDTLTSTFNRDFGSFELFKSQFKDVATKQFASGWAWLVVDKTGKLQVTSTPNMDNPLMPKQTASGTPIIGLDLWEHAYYLNYQYKRKKYVDTFFTMINWKKVNKKFDEAIAK
jgi:superoxide dismutase, Fe-Mn family